MLLKKKKLCIEFKPKYILEKLQKKLLFSNLKSTHSQLSLKKKINAVVILDHFLAPKECNSNTQGSQRVAKKWLPVLHYFKARTRKSVAMREPIRFENIMLRLNRTKTSDRTSAHCYTFNLWALFLKKVKFSLGTGFDCKSLIKCLTFWSHGWSSRPK